MCLPNAGNKTEKKKHWLSAEINSEKKMERANCMKQSITKAFGHCLNYLIQTYLKNRKLPFQF